MSYFNMAAFTGGSNPAAAAMAAANMATIYGQNNQSAVAANAASAATIPTAVAGANTAAQVPSMFNFAQPAGAASNAMTAVTNPAFNAAAAAAYQQQMSMFQNVYNPANAYAAMGVSTVAATGANPMSAAMATANPYAAYMVNFQQQQNAAAAYQQNSLVKPVPVSSNIHVLTSQQQPTFTQVKTEHSSNSHGYKQQAPSGVATGSNNTIVASSNNRFNKMNATSVSASYTPSSSSNSSSSNSYRVGGGSSMTRGDSSQSRYNSGGGNHAHTKSFNKTLTGGPSSFHNTSTTHNNSSSTVKSSTDSTSAVSKTGSYFTKSTPQSQNSTTHRSITVIGAEDSGGSGSNNKGASSSANESASYAARGPMQFCDVCKISCAGPQTYKEHLEGQKHKKKEQQMKQGFNGSGSGGVSGSTSQSSSSVKPGQKTFYCELCDVTCTSADTYNAHARGAKHVKCVKLYQKMNKPIPPAKEVIVNAVGEEPTVVSHKMNNNNNKSSQNNSSNSSNSSSTNYHSNYSSGGGGSSATNWHHHQSRSNSSYSPSNKNSHDRKTQHSHNTTSQTSSAKSGTGVSDASSTDLTSTYVEDGLLKDDCDPDPIGGEYIDEWRDADNKLVEFNCKLCDCKFNDPYAKDMHLKGRRHRFMYKRKVNPELEVDLKPGFRNKRIIEDRARTRKQREDLNKRLAEDHAARMQMRRLEEQLYFRVPGSLLTSQFESWDDRHIVAKHATIYPSDAELEAVQKLVVRAEKALKVVSDKLAIEDMKDPDIRKVVLTSKERECENEEADNKTDASTAATKMDDDTAVATKSSDESEKPEAEDKVTKDAAAVDDSLEKPNDTVELTTAAANDKVKVNHGEKISVDSRFRQVKGVMRIGALAKGLLLRGDKVVELAVLCQDVPTKTLLARVFKALSQQMSEVTDDKYNYEVKVEDCAIIVTSQDEFRMQLKASLTSPAVLELDKAASKAPPFKDSATAAAAAVSNPNNPNFLNKTRCIGLLAELRRAKWFQSRATNITSCVVVMRILKDMIRRCSSWQSLSQWIMEVLVERVVGSSPVPLSPGDALRRVLESIAGGVLLTPSVGSGIIDPCEDPATPVDVSKDLRSQDREDITASAQHALRCMVFKQIHKVLAIEVMQPPTPSQIRKRRIEQMEEAALKEKQNKLRANEAKREKLGEDNAINGGGDKESNNTGETVNGKTADSSASVANKDGTNQDKATAASGSTSNHGYSSGAGSGYHHNEEMVDPGGEAAAYEAMHYEDAYDSYYGHLNYGGPPSHHPPFHPHNHHPMRGPGGFSPRPFRPMWRGGGMPMGGMRGGGRGPYRPW